MHVAPRIFSSTLIHSNPFSSTFIRDVSLGLLQITMETYKWIGWDGIGWDGWKSLNNRSNLESPKLLARFLKSMQSPCHFFES